MEDQTEETSPQTLRRIGLITAALIAGLFGIALPWLFGRIWPFWPWIAAGVLAIWSSGHPASFGLAYRRWMKVALVLGRVNSALLLGAVFFIVFTPAGIIMRRFGYDPLRRKLLPGASSYRRKSMQPPPGHMRNPY